MKLRRAGCLSSNSAPPAGNKQSALPPSPHLTFLAGLILSLAYSSRIPTGGVHLEWSSQAVTAQVQNPTHTPRAHTKKNSNLLRPAAPCSHPQGLDSSWRKCTQTEGRRRQSEGAKLL